MNRRRYRRHARPPLSLYLSDSGPLRRRCCNTRKGGRAFEHAPGLCRCHAAHSRDERRVGREPEKPTAVLSAAFCSGRPVVSRVTAFVNCPGIPEGAIVTAPGLIEAPSCPLVGRRLPSLPPRLQPARPSTKRARRYLGSTHTPLGCDSARSVVARRSRFAKIVRAAILMKSRVRARLEPVLSLI